VVCEDEAHPAFKLFILDKSRQHVRGKVEVWPAGKQNFRLKLETTLKKEEYLCQDVEDYAALRNCIRKYLERIEGG
jgi:hypothetical protein